MKSWIIILMLIGTTIILAQSNEPKGSISGNILDIETKTPLIGVNIYIKSTQTGTTTNSDGFYQLTNVPVGLINVVFSYIGYEAITKTDVNVKPDRTTFLNIEMNPSAVELGDVVVTNGYFSELENKPVSTVNFSSEEIRRSPGTAGDVSRILFTLPSIAKINDQRNSLIVRGGTPVENSFYLDNIEIPNINHFPVEGSSDGPIGILNADFIDDVNFHSGGFSPIFGDRMSSIMEISYREGEKNRFSPQLNLNMAGVGGAVEGSAGEKLNYLFSFNRSYVDLIVNQIEEGSPLPKYGDVQGKVVYDIDENNRLSFLDILSIDYVYLDENKAVENDANMYGETNGILNTGGANWQHIWSNQGYSNTSIAYTYTKSNNDYSKTVSRRQFYTNQSKDNTIRMRNVNYLKLNDKNSIEFGSDLSAAFTKFNTFYGAYEDQYGNTTRPLNVNNNKDAYKVGVFSVHHLNFLDVFKLDYGARVDYFTYNQNINFSPRATLTYSLNPKTSFSVSSGLFYQNIPNNILVQSEDFKSLKTPSAVHYIAGFSHNLGDATRLSIEAYYKQYNNFPVNPEMPTMFLFDQVQVYGIFWSNKILKDNGKADAEGIEVTLQKKLAEDFYGLVSGSISNTAYEDSFGKRHDRIYDNRFNFNLEGGYIPGNDWEFKIRWVYAGGAPYTPFNYEASKAAGVGIWDLSRTNSERLPDYHSMNIRIDKKFYFDTSSLLVYLSVWNVYSRKNIAFYYWNEVTNEQDVQTQWSTLPVLGVEYEF
ncbi:MAG TPA: TonB-dependent receptor [Ignavibacteriaceae bacterium]|nr:TonB-dependent receptor [Ignavibacteriaceae bacterium]